MNRTANSVNKATELSSIKVENIQEGEIISVWDVERRNTVQSKVCPSPGITVCIFFWSSPIQFFLPYSLSFNPLILFIPFQFKRISWFHLTNASSHFKIFSKHFLWLSAYFSLYILSLWILEELWEKKALKRRENLLPTLEASCGNWILKLRPWNIQTKSLLLLSNSALHGTEPK